MSHGEKLFAPPDDLTSRPSFELALRGYDKRQVDRYLSRVDSETSALAGERERAHRHLQDLAAQLNQARAELTELRQRPPQVDRASFRDLGPTVDQILGLAEHQAEAITNLAAQRAADLQAEAERVLAGTRQQADRLRAETEAAYERAEQEAERINEQIAQQVEQARAEAEALVEAARAQTGQEIRARQEALTELQAELDTARQHLTQSRQDGAIVEREVAQLQQRLGEVGQDLAAELDRLDEARRAAESAERHAKDVRARVQREAERVAQLAAAAVMAAAARGAETGEYPMVVPVRSGANGVADQATEPTAGTVAPTAGTVAPTAGSVAPDPEPAADGGDHARYDTDHVVLTQRGPHPGGVAADTELPYTAS